MSLSREAIKDRTQAMFIENCEGNLNLHKISGYDVAMGFERVSPTKFGNAGVPRVLEIRKRQKELLRSMMTANSRGEVSYEPLLTAGSSGTQSAAGADPGPSGSCTQSAVTVDAGVLARQEAWKTRLWYMAATATKFTNSSMEALHTGWQTGIDGLLSHFDLVLKQNGLDTIYDNKCLSLELLRCLFVCPDADLPLPPRLFVGTVKSAMFGEEGFELEGFWKRVAEAPNCFISDSLLGVTNVEEPTKHQFRNCHELLWRNGCRGHVVKCMPCATLAQLSCAILGYLDLIGAGHTEDKERVRIADNLGVLVVGWALSDLRSYHSADYMLSGALRRDIISTARMLRFHSKVIWIVGGDGSTYGLNPSFTAAQSEVCELLRSEGQVVWTGIDMVRELARFPHYREDGRIDQWHYEENPVTMEFVSRHLFNVVCFASCS